ncbi:hypothetical protein [Novosphingobium sp. M1R2S20]|uniref:Uncharacterized protein n=1 Tax=Novosphingobium rhizovicinum TaxID=3228928 RepID=A0ABV3RCT3_9SPHN
MSEIKITKADADFAKAIEEQCAHGDPEGAHSTADDLLIQLLLVLGCEKTVAAWSKVEKWYA